MKNHRVAVIALIAALSALFAPTALAITIVNFTYDGWISAGNKQYLQFSWVTLDDEKVIQLQFMGGADNTCSNSGGSGGSNSGGGGGHGNNAQTCNPYNTVTNVWTSLYISSYWRDGGNSHIWSKTVTLSPDSSSTFQFRIRVKACVLRNQGDDGGDTNSGGAAAGCEKYDWTGWKEIEVQFGAG